MKTNSSAKTTKKASTKSKTARSTKKITPTRQKKATTSKTSKKQPAVAKIPPAVKVGKIKEDKPPIKNPKTTPVKAIVTISASKSSAAVEAKKFAPYQQFGIHGKNVDLEGYEKGDPVEFFVGGETKTGTFVHFHKNNHSPNGYAVIRCTQDEKLYERVIGKFSKISKKKAKATVPSK